MPERILSNPYFNPFLSSDTFDVKFNPKWACQTSGDGVVCAADVDSLKNDRLFQKQMQIHGVTKALSMLDDRDQSEIVSQIISHEKFKFPRGPRLAPPRAEKDKLDVNLRSDDTAPTRCNSDLVMLDGRCTNVGLGVVLHNKDGEARHLRPGTHRYMGDDKRDEFSDRTKYIAVSEGCIATVANDSMGRSAPGYLKKGVHMSGGDKYGHGRFGENASFINVQCKI
jgi:hypothetical protein